MKDGPGLTGNALEFGERVRERGRERGERERDTIDVNGEVVDTWLCRSHLERNERSDEG